LNHTKLPWRVEEIGGEPFIFEESGKGFCIALIRSPGYSENGDEASELGNAEFIVKACNAHDDLVKLLQGIKASLQNGDVQAEPVKLFCDNTEEFFDGPLEAAIDHVLEKHDIK